MGMGMIPVLMDRDDVIEVPVFGLEEPLRHLRRDVPNILAARPDRIGQKHMGRLSKLRLEPRAPALREALRQVLDLFVVELRLAIEEAGTVHDMGGLSGQISKLVREF